MKISLAERRGFCYGVTRAIDKARQAAAASNPVYTVGPLIHNPQMIQKLAGEGVRCVDSLDEITAGTVVVRSHGEGPQFFAALDAKAINTVDATCENVKRAQRAAKQMVDKGLCLVVLGDRKHPEVQAILAWSDPSGLTIEKSEQVSLLPADKKLGIVVQTTFSVDELQAILASLNEAGLDYELDNTVCQATKLRQDAARNLATKVDAMIVVGGRNSANTKHLEEVCREVNQRVHLIETAEELKAEWFRGVQHVGLTAGASTPDWIIEEVIHGMENMDQIMREGSSRLEKGTVMAGKVVGISKDVVFVDIGQKSEGFISLDELAWPIPADAHDVVTQGQLLNVMVLDPETAEGSIKLSRIQAERLMAWDSLEESMQTAQVLDVAVTAAVKGGLSVAVFGVRGFIPASQVANAFIEDLSVYVGKTLQVLVIEVDREKQRVVLSARVLLEKKRKEEESAALGNIQVGQVIRGTVKRMATFGGFVDIGGIEGLVHVSEMAWHRVKDASEVLKVGDEVDVKVLKIDPETKKISLGMKQLQEDPWHTAVSKFAEGSTVTGKVTRTSKFGAFVELVPGVEGLVHISELADHRVTNAEEVVKTGQKVPVKILSLDPASKRISLSVIKAQEDAERKDFEQYLGSSSALGVTIGDKLGHLFKKE